MEVFKRILGSKKVLLTVIPSIFTVVGASQGIQDLVILSVDALFAVLVVVQGALDMKHGSPSDGTDL